MKNGKNIRNINTSNSFAKNKGDILFYCLVLLIPLTQIAIFYFGVNFQSILMSFQSYNNKYNYFYWDIGANATTFWIEASKPAFWIMVRDSFIVWLCTQLAGTVLA